MPIGRRYLFTWVHLSDLHFGHGTASYQWDQQAVLDNIEADIKKALGEWPELPKPDAVIVTGDIAFSGGVLNPSEYKDAFDYFTRIKDTLGLQPGRLFFVPGNHDVQRGISQSIIDDVRKDPGALDALLKSPQGRTDLDKRQANYKAFADQFVIRDLQRWVEKINVPGFGEIELVGLNSAAVSNDDLDQGKLVLSGEQRAAINKSPSLVRLLLTHHPFDSGWLNDESKLQSLASQPYTVHLCGHVHDPRVDAASSAGGALHITVVAAAAHRDPKEKESHGYNISSLMIDARGDLKVRTWPRRWFPGWNSFRVDHLNVPDRKFYDDKTLNSDDSRASGLVFDRADELRLAGVHWWGKPVIRWDQLLAGKQRLEVFGISARGVLGDNIDHIVAFLDRGGELYVVLADPLNTASMARYDDDFRMPLGDRSRKTIDVLAALEGLSKRLKSPNQLKVALSPYTFKYSAYRIDGDVLMAPYRTFPGRDAGNIPALTFDKESTIARRFLGPDLDNLLARATPLTFPLSQAILDARLK